MKFMKMIMVCIRKPVNIRFQSSMSDGLELAAFNPFHLFSFPYFHGASSSLLLLFLGNDDSNFLLYPRMLAFRFIYLYLPGVLGDGVFLFSVWNFSVY